MRRSASFAIVCLFALACTSCSSNNTGKIVGKWKASSADLGVPADVTVIYEFTADGRFTIGGPGGSIGGKYSLGMGDNVSLSDINPPIDGKTKSREKIVIAGDVMTLDGPGGKKISLSRVK